MLCLPLLPVTQLPRRFALLAQAHFVVTLKAMPIPGTIATSTSSDWVLTELDGGELRATHAVKRFCSRPLRSIVGLDFMKDHRNGTTHQFNAYIESLTKREKAVCAEYPTVA